MTENKFIELTTKKASSLKAVFLFEHGFLATVDPITINHNAFENTFTISIAQNGIRRIEIRAETATMAGTLWTILWNVARLAMLFEGEFLQLRSAEFLLDDNTTPWGDELVQEYQKRMLSFYSSADFARGCSKFANSLSVLSDELLNGWIQIEDELELVHPMVLYGMSSVNLPIDLKAAILVESFESLFELIQKYNPEFQMAPKQTKPNGEKDSKLRRILEAIIQSYGQDIFGKEKEKDLPSFCQVLTNSRNRMFHIKTKANKMFLGGSESVLYAAKLSLLYRRVLLDILGIDYTVYSERLKEIVSRWNGWNGVLDFFLATKWTD